MTNLTKPHSGFWFTRYLPFIGFVAGGALWLVNSAIDTLILHEGGSYFESLLPREMTEIWMRTLVIAVFTAGGVLGKILVGRLESLAHELAAHKEQLEELVEERTRKLEEQNQVLEKLAITDPLTGLHNRRYFHHVLCGEMDRFARTPTPFSLLMLDVDHFKAINDNFGHNTGDSVLIELASLLRNTVRITDIPARWGGEEFIILLPATPLEGAQHLAEKLRAICASHRFEVDRQITVSIGVAEYNMSLSESELLNQVDEALYFAKKSGRNRIEAA